MDEVISNFGTYQGGNVLLPFTPPEDMGDWNNVEMKKKHRTSWTECFDNEKHIEDILKKKT